MSEVADFMKSLFTKIETDTKELYEKKMKEHSDRIVMTLGDAYTKDYGKITQSENDEFWKKHEGCTEHQWYKFDFIEYNRELEKTGRYIIGIGQNVFFRNQYGSHGSNNQNYPMVYIVDNYGIIIYLQENRNTYNGFRYDIKIPDIIKYEKERDISKLYPFPNIIIDIVKSITKKQAIHGHQQFISILENNNYAQNSDMRYHEHSIANIFYSYLQKLSEDYYKRFVKYEKLSKADTLIEYDKLKKEISDLKIIKEQYDTLCKKEGITHKMTELESLKLQIKQLNDTNKKIVDKLKETNKTYQLEIDQLKRELNQIGKLEEINKNKDLEMKKLKGEIIQMETTIYEIEQLNESNKKTVDKLKEDNKKQQIEIQELKTKLDEIEKLKEINKKQDEKIKDLESTIALYEFNKFKQVS